MDRATRIEIEKMNALFERMNGHYTQLEAQAINEGIEELDARNREDMDTAEFFKMQNKIKGGTKSTIGYVSAANLNIPTVNKMKDWKSFGKNIGAPGNVAGVVKFARYTFNWRSPQAMHDHYENAFVNPANAIRSKFGLADIQKQTYPALSTDPASGNANFFAQDTGGADCHKVIMYFLVGYDGKIIKWPGTAEGEVPTDVLKDYFKKSSPSGIADLRKMAASDETIKQYAEEMAKIKFRYTRFNTGSIVYVITNIDGKKLRFFNPNLVADLKEIDIDPNEYISLAKRMYKLDLQQSI